MLKQKSRKGIVLDNTHAVVSFLHGHLDHDSH